MDPVIENDEEDFVKQSPKTDRMVWCQICGVNLSELTMILQTKHINLCCKETQEISIYAEEEHLEDKGIVMYCSACGISLKGKTAENKINHFKKCHKKNKTSLSDLQKIKSSKQQKDSISVPIPSTSKPRKSLRRSKQTPANNSQAKSRKSAVKSKEKSTRSKKSGNKTKNIESNTTIMKSPPAEFLNVINKAHYRPQSKSVTVRNIKTKPKNKHEIYDFFFLLFLGFTCSTFSSWE